MIKNKLFNDKKGDNKLLSPWLFVIFVIIGVTVVIAVLIFYSNFGDVRYEESKIIVSRLIGAISNNGYLKEVVFLNEFDIFKEAQLDKKKFYNPGLFYFRIVVYDNDKEVLRIFEGNKDFEIQCAVSGTNFAKCQKKEFYLKSQNDPLKNYKISILAGSNQQGGKV